ncbi:MAG: OmpA family protein [Spirochaetales bacterium]|nr:OmpA family protein [Spirochaetales bacterium]
MFNVGIRLYDNSIYSVGDTSTAEGARIAVTTIVDNQKTAEVEIYLITEKGKEKTHSYIGKIIIHNIPPANAGEPRINLVITSDEERDLKVLVFNKEEPCGQMEIPYRRWHPEMREEEEAQEVEETKTIKKEEIREVKKSGEGEEETIETTVLREDIRYTSKGEYKLDFDSRTYQTDKSSSTRLTTASDTEKTEEKEETESTPEEKESKPFPLIVAGIAVILVIALLLLFLVIKPWEAKVPAVTEIPRTEKTEDETASEAVTEEEVSEAVTEEETSVSEESTITEPVLDIDTINEAVREIGPVYFSPNSSRLTENAVKTIDRISGVLSGYVGEIEITVTGHTAKYGTYEEQEALSVERAKAVRSRLVSNGAITDTLASYEGFGARKPATADRSKDSLNRRVEIMVSEQE